MRVVLVWAVLSLGLAALAGAGVDDAKDRAARAEVCAVVCAAVAAGVATSTQLGFLRRGRVAVDPSGPPWGVWRRAAVAVVVGAAAGVFVGFVGVGHARSAVALTFWCCLCAAVVARLLVRPALVARPIARSRWRWLFIESALPSALIAGSVGAVVGHVRYGVVDVVAPGGLSRTLAGTTLCYLLLGLGAFIKARHEHQSGLVVVVEPPRSVPGFFFVGLVVAAAAALGGPWLLPPLSGAAVAVVKGLFGVVVGGGLSLLGGHGGHARGAAHRQRD